ncbi:MAG: hypothetical protein ACJ74B_02065 [Gaiellaceae bacterium]
MRHFGRRGASGLLVLAGALVAATCAAAGPAVSTTTPVMYMGSNPCTGEPFTGNGTAHMTMTDGVSASGNIEFHLDARIDGLKAVTVTGKTYVVQETSPNWQISFSKAFEETFVLLAHYVRVGDDGSFVLGDDFYEYLKTHVTANANGIPTGSQVSTSDPLDPCQ